MALGIAGPQGARRKEDQWQAQELPQGVEADALALEPPAADADESPEVAEAAADPPPSAALAFAAEAPPRKSVTYQPDPLSWKPAAVTCLRKLSESHCGQRVSTGSEIF
jgi:hypothetical protein